MTLTELKYVIAVARERHFGRAAESCFVSQPSLSVAIKKLEEELGVSIFERRPDPPRHDLHGRPVPHARAHREALHARPEDARLP